MLTDPRLKILQDIEGFTNENLFMGAGAIADHAVYYEELDVPEVNILYLVTVRKTRVLVYGMERIKSALTNFDYMFGMPKQFSEEPENEKVSLFCKRVEAQPYEINEILDGVQDGLLEGLEGVYPEEDESNEDFFLRNAMWLLNPTIH